MTIALDGGLACMACGRPGGHPGRQNLAECPPLARAIVRRTKEFVYRRRRWAAGDAGALQDPLREVRAREAKEAMRRTREQFEEVGRVVDDQRVAFEGVRDATVQLNEVAAEYPELPVGAIGPGLDAWLIERWTRLRWWALGWRDYLARKWRRWRGERVE